MAKKGSGKPKKSASKKKASSKKASSKRSTRKKASSKGSQSKKAPRETKKEEIWESPFFLLAILAGLIIIFAIIAYSLNAGYEGDGDIDQGDIILATVNGEPIMQSRLDFQYQLLPANYKQQLSREEVLEQIINEELVVQRAQEEGVVVSDEQLNERVQEILAQGGLSVSDLQRNLDFFNITMDEFEALVRRQLIIQEYTSQAINVSPPGDEELRDLYDANEQRYMQEEQVTVRHVLISAQRDDAAKLAQDIYERARSGADFCALVENYTADDRGSRENCGEYTFPRNFMVPEFEEASFEMEPGQYRMIQTSFGYHIIHKIEDVPARLQPFDEVRSELEQTYLSAERSRQYEILIADLREDAQITYGEGDGVYEVPSQSDDVEELPDDDADETLIESGPEPTDETAILTCIADETILYGTSWSTDTRESIAMFEDEGVELEYVLCDEDGARCEAIEAYPTWVIDDELLLGKLSLEDLQQAAGCE